jgi:hypothetical protein
LTAQTITYFDDFNYTHDFTTGVPGLNPSATDGGGIWSGVVNAGAGGTPTNASAAGTGGLTMGMTNVRWENSEDSAPYLFREVDVNLFQRVTVKISAQTPGNWSFAGPMVREPNPIGDGNPGDFAVLPADEDWYASRSFRPAGSFMFSRLRVLNGDGCAAAAPASGTPVWQL